MKSLRASFITLLCITFFLTACSSEDDGIFFTDVEKELIVSKTSYSEIEQEILELINLHRNELGLSSLELMDVISSVAKDHTDYMIETADVSHANFADRSQLLIDNAGAEKVAENIAYGYSSASSVIKAWLNSPSHKKIIEESVYTHFGISTELNDQGRYYFTNIFIKK